METLQIPRVIIGGGSSGVGKSLLTLGIAYQLRKRNVSVSCAVTGSTLLEAGILRRISARYVRSLDDRLLSWPQTLATLHQASLGADLLLIEGHKGFFDGRPPGTITGSDAELSSVTRTPSIVVLDPARYEASAAALAQGFLKLSDQAIVKAVVFNKIIDPGLADTYAKSLQGFGMPPSAGMVPVVSLSHEIPQQALSQVKNESILPRQFFLEVEQMVAQYVNIDEVIAIAESAESVQIDEYEHAPSGRRCRIAVSDDSCFSVGYQDNLDLLRFYGAELVPFSPLADSDLPRGIGGVYLCGAYLREYAEGLAANNSMRACLSDFAAQGGVVYSEGSGTAYLCREFRTERKGPFYPGVGVIPASAVPDDRGVSYYEAVTIEDSVLGRAGLVVRGIDSGEWRLKREERMHKVIKLAHQAEALEKEGFSPFAQMVATFRFAHFGSNPELAANLVDSAEVVGRSSAR